jgi:photosystem II stability/assembly factor-like uncharacterized protein
MSRFAENMSRIKMLFTLCLCSLLWGGVLLPSPCLSASGPVGWLDMGLDGGQVYCVAIDPVDPTIMCAGTYYGDGFFKSTDGGAHWESVDGFRNNSVLSIAFDPQDHATLWVATFYYIYKSRDGGITWTRFDPAVTAASYSNYYSLAIDPVNGNTVYVGTSGPFGSNDGGAVYKTSDGGATWARTSLAADHNVWDLAVNPGRPQEVWAVTGPDWVTDGSIYRSRDGGATWTQIDTGLAAGWYWFVAVNPRDSRTIFIGGENGLYRTRDGGITWSQLAPNSWCRGLCFDSVSSTVYASWFDSQLQEGFVSKSINNGTTWTDNQIAPLEFVYLVSHPQSSGVLFAGDGRLGVYKSEDGGATWNASTQGIRANQIHTSVITPNKRVMVGSTCGLYSRPSSGTWRRINSSPVFALASAPNNDNQVYAGLDFTLGKSRDAGENWSFLNIPSTETNKVRDIAVDPLTPDTLYLAIYFSSGQKGEIFKSTDGGESILKVKSFNVPVNAIQVNPANTQVLYAGTGMFYAPVAPGGVYKSTDGGETWTTLGTGVIVNALALDRQNPDTLYVGCGSGAGFFSGLYKTTDGGATWEEKDFGIPAFSGIVDVKIDPLDHTKIYAATSRNGIYMSANAGTYWTRLGLSEYWIYNLLLGVTTTSPSLRKSEVVRVTTGSSDLFAGSGSGMLEFTGSGLGAIAGTVSGSGSGIGLTSATLSTDTGGIALSLAGYYLMVATAGQCTVNASLDGYQSAARTGVVVPSGGQVTVDLNLMPLEKLYFPHIASNSLWETEIAIVNASATETVTGTLRPFGDSGAAVSNPVPITLPPHSRRQITISQEFLDPDSIGYLVFESDFSSVKGYTKFYRSGLYRAAIPATAEINTGDIYLTHVTSDPAWWTGVSVLNTTSQAKTVSFEFNEGTTITRSIAAQEHQKFLVSDLFNGQTPAGISSAVLTNASGIIGLELFSSANQVEGIPLSDATAATLYYPYVPTDAEWWAGIVAYNPSATACTLTITPYLAGGSPAAPVTRALNGKEKYRELVSNLGFPQNTAWFAIEASTPITGFELIGTADSNQVGGFFGMRAKKKEGVCAKLEKGGGWTSLTLVNTEGTQATVTLTAYDDSGSQVATTTFSLNAHAQVAQNAEEFFPNQDIATATYLAYSSDKDLVVLQLNGSADSTMLDGLPGL